MKLLINLCIILFIVACDNSSTIEQEKVNIKAEEKIESEINLLLQKDAKNKKLELEYLEQIRIAEENNDHEAFRFYLNEYIKVERLDISEELKSHPNYFQGGQRIKY